MGKASFLFTVSPLKGGTRTCECMHLPIIAVDTSDTLFDGWNYRRKGVDSERIQGPRGFVARFIVKGGAHGGEGVDSRLPVAALPQVLVTAAPWKSSLVESAFVGHTAGLGVHGGGGSGGAGWRSRLGASTTRWMCSASGTPRLVVIGGGAAGFMGAIEAARGAKELGAKLDVVVLEATSKCCSKVKISGGGRCNVMHDETKPLNIITGGYPRGQKQLLGPFTRFGPPETAAWFRSEGVQLKTEVRTRPRSHSNPRVTRSQNHPLTASAAARREDVPDDGQ